MNLFISFDFFLYTIFVTTHFFIAGDNDLYLAGASCSDVCGFGSMMLYKFSPDDSDFDDSCITQYDKEDVADRRQ